MRAVFDTNIFISAFVIPGGNAEEACLQAVRATFELFTSIAILIWSVWSISFVWLDWFFAFFALVGLIALVRLELVTLFVEFA